VSGEEQQLARERPQEETENGADDCARARAMADRLVDILLEQHRRARVDVAENPVGGHKRYDVSAIDDPVVGCLHNLGEIAFADARRAERVDRRDAIAEA